MIRLGTVFSGIGAIEHALERMGLEHKIIFACDNGDVEYYKHTVDMDLGALKGEIQSLGNQIKKVENEISNEANNSLERRIAEKGQKDNVYIEQLQNMYEATVREFECLMEWLENKLDTKQTSMDIDFELCANELANVAEQLVSKYKGSKKKQVTDMLNHVRVCDDTKNLVFHCLELFFKIEDDLKETDLECFSKLLSLIGRTEGKKCLKSAKDICERIGMLFEKFRAQEIITDLNQMTSYKDKKKYVDKLYQGKERQNKVKQSYLANYDLDEEHFHWNVSFLDGYQYRDQVDLFVGGSPCQSFSLVGKQRGMEDTRGTLFYEYARLIDEIRPKVFIYENVKALLSNDDGRTWEKMQEVFASLNYEIFDDVLNAKDYGIPQNRERVFVVGFRKDLLLKKEFAFPPKIKLEKKMQDFLMDNVEGQYYLNKKGVDFVLNEKNLSKRYTQVDGEVQLCQKKNQQFNWHGDFVFVEEPKNKEVTIKNLEKYFLSEKVRKYVMSSGTKGFYSRPQIDLEIARPLLTTMHKMHRAGVDNYVTTDGRIRKLTPRECLRLMGFCDSFKIVVSDTAAYQQAGNSIVVNVLMSIMKSILESYPDLDYETDEERESVAM